MQTMLSLSAAALFAFSTPAAAASFDCGRATTPVETMICSDPKLSAYDALIAARYEALLARLDAPSARALREDQRWFLSARDATMALIPKDDPERIGVLHSWLVMRMSFLASIETQRAPGLEGLWSNVAGEVLLSHNADGSVSLLAHATDPAGARWTCMAKGRTAGTDAEVRFVDPDVPGWNILVRRAGASLRVEEQREDGKIAASPFCGLNGGLKGHYFPRSTPLFDDAGKDEPLRRPGEDLFQRRYGR